ncbi:hypothetical protein NDU88_003455 [Pleurodeles waltl]|uniref:Uncharacterized protein n=1 Tax=Pleurodeles waltl TaxID=8319 RepID=A0AAV7W6Y7_PLEWA|nr:hypothetical protein NDU88_003455 [Pleurodeles waltl]
MDSMSEHLDKHTEHLDMVKQSVLEDQQVTMSEVQKRLHKMVLTLQSNIEDLKARPHLNNLQIKGLEESMDNMGRFVERLLAELLGQETFSDFFVAEQAHRSLAPWPVPGATPCPVIARLLNYRDHDRARRKARELRALYYEDSWRCPPVEEFLEKGKNEENIYHTQKDNLTTISKPAKSLKTLHKFIGKANKISKIQKPTTPPCCYSCPALLHLVSEVGSGDMEGVVNRMAESQQKLEKAREEFLNTATEDRWNLHKALIC